MATEEKFDRNKDPLPEIKRLRAMQQEAQDLTLYHHKIMDRESLTTLTTFSGKAQELNQESMRLGRIVRLYCDEAANRGLSKDTIDRYIHKGILEGAEQAQEEIRRLEIQEEAKREKERPKQKENMRSQERRKASEANDRMNDASKPGSRTDKLNRGIFGPKGMASLEENDAAAVLAQLEHGEGDKGPGAVPAKPVAATSAVIKT